MIDFDDILKNCGGRLTLKDAELLYETAMSLPNPKILEIGCMDGCSTQVLGMVVREKMGHLYCIDPAPKQRWRYNVERNNLQEHVTFIFGASPWVPTSKIPDPIDYLFIDGDHRTRWCLVDYHYWEPFLRKGGLVGFHDWSGREPTGPWVRKAVELIVETDALEEVGRSEGGGRGYIVFRKTWDSPKVMGV